MLFAAGLGTRLKPFTDHHPKALAMVNGRTLLEHNIRYLQCFGINDVIVNVHHFADQIIDTITSNDGFGSHVIISDEQQEVLETGGGLLKAVPYFKDADHLVVMNVDVLTNLDLGRMIAAHINSASVATLAVMKRSSSRQLLFDDAMHLCGWENNQTGQQRMARETDSVQPFAFSGIQVLRPSLWEGIQLSGKFSLIDVYLAAARQAILTGYDHTGDVFLDVGKPESIEQAARLFS